MPYTIDLLPNQGDSTQKVAILTEGYSTPFAAKTANSFIRYRTDSVVGVIDKTEQGKTCQSLFGVGGEIPVVASLADCPDANMLLIGIAPPGGQLPAEWMPILYEAIARKMTIVSGLHDFLSENTALMQAANEQGATIVDVRKNDEQNIAMRENINHDCLKIHTVGHDCSIGKMVVSMELTRGLIEAGNDAKFIATGQTGIMISGEGAPIDCVKADFISGTVEKL
ncbi:Protein often near L-alanine-DL-glutamate epimerase (cell wall recycling), partial [hydrothermal vent metagenome]